MRIAYLSDIHLGEDQDLRALHFATTCLQKLNIDVVFLGGDIFDHTAVSSYGKSLEVEGKLQQELDHAFTELAMLRGKLSGAKFHFLPGNHETRLVRYLNKNARALSKLRALSYENLYRLDELNIAFHPEGKPVKFGHLYLAHGHEFPSGGRNPAWTAINAVNSNVLFGHVHRPSMSNKTELGGKSLGAWSNPCLSTLSPGYLLKPDWVQGFSIVDLTSSGFFAVQTIQFWRNEDSGLLSTLIEGKLHKERKADASK